MVTVRDNAIKLEVGVSYQWAMDAHAAIVRHIDSTKRAIRSWFATRRDNALARAELVRQDVANKAASARTGAASLLLGITPQQVDALQVRAHADESQLTANG